ncbi:MAG: dihydrolipoyl dehydrogenase [Myxococcales bacterium]|nr:dihydrolipoyl dehydrogenase [Myxococcales bacterium]
MKTFDVAVLGGGPGGYCAAIRAAQLGATVALVERDALGGTCTNRGCIPTKALSASAVMLGRMRSSEELGIRLPAMPELDFGRVAARRDQVVATLREGIEKLLRAHKVELFRTSGTLAGPGKIALAGNPPAVIEARRIILATGSAPVRLPNLPVDGERVVTSDEILSQKSLPRRLAVVGGGVIGCEFASIYRAFGVEVTVVELLERLLPTMEAVLGKTLERAFKKAGIQVFTATRVEGYDPGAGVLRLAEGKTLPADMVLVAVGRRPRSDGLGFAECGVQIERGRVVADERMATGAEGVFAVGDVVGRNWLAHTAMREGEVAAACALGHPERMRYGVVPAVVFSEPEIAVVGLQPAEAEAKKVDFAEGTFFYGASGKALCDGAAEGKVGLLAEPGGGKVLGGWVIGEHADVLIAEIALAVDRGVSARELADVIHAHPTLPEMIKEAAADCFGMAVHKAPARRRS